VSTALRSNVYIIKFIVAFLLARLHSSEQFDIALLGISPCRRPNFLLSEKKVGKETDTESLSDPNHVELS